MEAKSIEAGMYIRTDNGYISKILEFEKHYTKGKRKVDYCSVKEVVENYLLLQGKQCEIIESIDYSILPCYPSDEELEKIKSHIVKASYEILDLIELDDYVNSEKVIRIFKPMFMQMGELPYVVTTNSKYESQEIMDVVTKEQFSQMKYKIGE